MTSVISFHMPSKDEPFIRPPDVTVSDSFQFLDHLKILCYFKGEMCVIFWKRRYFDTMELFINFPKATYNHL